MTSRAGKARGMRANRTFALLAGVFGLIIVVSTVFFSLQLGLAPLNAVYFVITTNTTVG